jgi:hypothetical protein
MVGEQMVVADGVIVKEPDGVMKEKVEEGEEEEEGEGEEGKEEGEEEGDEEGDANDILPL